jgi:small-conductance mechanosensitive channel
VTELEGAGLNLLWLLLVGALLLASLLALRGVLALLPLSRRRRDFVEGAAPLIGSLAGFAYLLYSLRLMFADHPQYMPLVWGGAAVTVIGASWFAVRDLISGVLLKSGRVCKVGDRIRLADVEGVIRHMGLRLMAIESESGGVALVPYSKIASESVVRAPSRGAVLPHVFRVTVPTSVTMSDARSSLRLAISQCHWASLVREPELAVLSENTYEVTVFSLAAERSAEIEAAARASLEKLGPRPSP